MNVELKFFGRTVDGMVAMPGNEKPAVPAVPMELFRMHQWLTQYIAVMMRSFAIQQVSVTMEYAGTVPIVNVQWKPFPNPELTLPAPLAVMRPRIIRNLRDLCECFGIQDVALRLSDAELTELCTYFTYLSTGVAGNAAAALPDAPAVQAPADPSFERVPLQRDTDPTGTRVPLGAERG